MADFERSVMDRYNDNQTLAPVELEEEFDTGPNPNLRNLEKPEVITPRELDMNREVEFIVQRVINSSDIELEVLQKSADEALTLSLEKMKDIISTDNDPLNKISAVRAVTGVANNLLARKRIKSETKQRVHVTVSPALTVPQNGQRSLGTQADE